MNKIKISKEQARQFALDIFDTIVQDIKTENQCRNSENHVDTENHIERGVA